jgi:peptide deformylase
MQPLKVLTAIDPILRKSTKKIELFDDDLRLLLKQMMFTMDHYKGVGLAAPHVGKSLHIFTMKFSQETPYHMINLEILKKSDKRSNYKEGCLSFPNVFLDIARPSDVLVKYNDEHGNLIEKEFTGWESRCIQHELDHLNGILFTDSLSKDRQDFIIRKIKKGTPDF